MRTNPVILSLALSVGAAASIADEPPRLVGEFGGRAVVGHEVLVLDVEPPAIRRIDRRTLAVRTIPLSGSERAPDPYGIAPDGSGSLWVLADKGRSLLRFSAATGRELEKRKLVLPGQGVVPLWGRVGVIAIRLRAREPLLVEAGPDGNRPFSPIRSRSAADPTAHLIANLLRCGLGTADPVPCWFLAGEPDVALVRRDGNVKRVAVPSFVRPRRGRPPDGVPGAEFVYPVRDAFPSTRGLWVLSNQEGDRTPLEEEAVRGRHVTLVREGRPPRVVTLDREARAILDADASRLLLLYADGSVEAVAVR